ncbi:MAG: hypothetical protein V3U02_06650 [Calditrichia bacterium]
MKRAYIKPYTMKVRGKRVRVSGHYRKYATKPSERGIRPPISSGHGKVSGTAKRYKRSDGGYATRSLSSDRKRIAMHRGGGYSGD